MASPTAVKKYSRQLVLIMSASMDDIVTEHALSAGISRAEAGRHFLASGMVTLGYKPQLQDSTPAEKAVL